MGHNLSLKLNPYNKNSHHAKVVWLLAILNIPSLAIRKFSLGFMWWMFCKVCLSLLDKYIYLSPFCKD